MRRRARTFHLAGRFLPARIRQDVQTVYAFYRSVDDAVDDPPIGWSRTDILALLDAWEVALRRGMAGANPLLADLLRVVDRYDIPLSDLLMVVDGMRMDLDLGTIEDRDHLLRYCVLVAGSVGMVMARVLGASEDEAIAAACDLGIGMQLTNILRDVSEDLDRGRIYLPGDELRHTGALADLRDKRLSTPLHAIIADLILEAHRRYDHGQQGLRFLDPAVRRPIVLAAHLYARILDKIEDRNYDVFVGRAHVGPFEKWYLTAQLLLLPPELS